MKNILNHFKKENGITLVALITTIIVLTIISVPIIMNTSNITEYRKFTGFKKDLLNLKEAITNLYGTDNNLSSDPNNDMYIGPEFTEWQTFINNVSNKSQGGNAIINPNDKESTETQITYLVIDFNNLSKKYSEKYNINLKQLYYGERNKDLENTSDDVYIINIQSRTIYYVKGYEINNVTYYRYQEPYTKV